MVKPKKLLVAGFERVNNDVTEPRNGAYQKNKLRNEFQKVLRRSVMARNIYVKSCAGP